MIAFNYSFGQSIFGNIEGTILNQNGTPAHNVSVNIFGNNISTTLVSSSDSLGIFRLLGIPAGDYNLSIKDISYRSYKSETFHVFIGQSFSVGNIILRTKVYNLPEVVVLENKNSFISSSTESGGHIINSTFNTLPIERNYKSISAIMPRVNESYSGDGINISGSTGLGNIFYIDGINVTDPADAATSTNLPYNFIQEIEIKTGGYQAEYGRSLGGIVNVITPSGGSDFKAQAFGFFTNSALGGKTKTGLTSAKVENYVKYDYGASISGPILKEKLWFYAAYNPNFENSSIRLANLGLFQATKTSHLFAGKLTWQIAKNTNLVLSAIGDPSSEEQVMVDDIGDFTLLNPDPILQKRLSGGVNYSLSAKHVINQNILLESSVSHLSQRETMDPSTEKGWDGLYMDLVEGTVQGGRQVTQNDNYSRSSFRINGTFFLKSHTFKTGIEFESNIYNIAIKNISELSWLYRTNVSTWFSQYINYSGKAENRILTAFVQDRWDVSSYLTLNFGLRLDGQTFYDSNGNSVQKINNEIQPRAGIVLEPFDNKLSRVFFSYGHFYEQIPTRFVALNYLKRTNYVTQYPSNPLLSSVIGETNNYSANPQKAVNDLRGQYYEEYTLGFEHNFLDGFKFGITGIYRNIDEVIDDFINPETGQYIIGNPGRGETSFIPKFIRKYQALEFTLSRLSNSKLSFLTSYVLSKNDGNYTGLYNQDDGDFLPNMNFIPDLDFQLNNAEGLLPNNITHVFKISCSYTFNFGVSVGANFKMQSGSPISEYGLDPYFNQFPIFLSKRGSVGNTPDLKILDLRIKLNMGPYIKTEKDVFLIVDIFNALNENKAVRIDQQHYYSNDANGNPSVENPNYLNPVKYTAPRMIRVGFEAHL